MKALKWIVALVVMSIIAFSLSCAGAGGNDVDTMPIFPLVVNGTAYDQNGQFIIGASVLVVSYNDTGVKICSKYTVTDVDGYYSVTFGQNEWAYGGLIEAILTFEGGTEIETVVVTDVPVITIDFHILYEIPEFGSLWGLLIVVIAVASINVLVMMWLRRRGRRDGKTNL